MEKTLIQDLTRLVDAGVLSEDKAEEIRHFYKQDEKETGNRQFIIFGLLGAILVGLGVILILAHNWDQLARPIKTLIALAPLIIAQSLCIYTVAQKRDSRTWLESTATLLVFAVGASMAMISQIYNLPGDLASFMLTWTLLILPIIYLMPSTMAAVLFLVGITYYGIEAGYWSPGNGKPTYYWFLLLLLSPYYFYLVKLKPTSNFTYLLNWLVPISITILLGTIAQKNAIWLFAAYFNLFGVFYLIGKSVPQFRDQWKNNGYLATGSAGTIILLLILSFSRIWAELADVQMIFYSIEFLVSAVLFIVAMYLLIKQIDKRRRLISSDPTVIVFLLFSIIFIFGIKVPTFSVVLINLLLFVISLFIIRKAMNSINLGLLNYGLLVITALIICRFFDTNISFVLRGLLFVLIGIGFFIANYRLIKSST